MLCQATLVKKIGVQCSYRGVRLCRKDGHYYCGKHINRFEVKTSPKIEETVKECSICYCAMHELFRVDSVTTPCNHTFHTTCLSKWKQTGAVTCPLCRGRLSDDDQVSTKLKQNAGKYTGFQLWCIQKKLEKKLIHSPERNRYYFFKTADSVTLQEELTRITALTYEQVFEKLINLCHENPTLLTDNM